MGTKVLKNVSPLGDLDVPFVGVVKAGKVFEVDEPLAGKPASPWRALELDDEGGPAEVVPRHLTRVVTDEETGAQRVEVYDPGEGLLAQPESYELSTKAALHEQERAERGDPPPDGHKAAAPADEQKGA